MKRLLFATIGVSAVLAAAVWTANLSAQVTHGKTRPLKTKQLMKGLVAANCGALKKALDAGPATDEAWDAVALHAALLNEANYILMSDGRCPDATWAGAAKTLGECSGEVLKAAEAKDLEKTKTAFAAMTKACGACHTAHKK
jgi:hypothetical protein